MPGSCLGASPCGASIESKFIRAAGCPLSLFRAVALLVLLPAAAGAGIVAPYFLVLPHHGRHLRGLGRAGEAQLARLLLLAPLHLLLVIAERLGFGLLLRRDLPLLLLARHDARMEEGAHAVALDPLHQILEHVERLFFVLDQ